MSSSPSVASDTLTNPSPVGPKEVPGVTATSAGAYSDDPAAYVYLPEGIILVKSPQASTGITKGCNPPANTRFCPEDPVTRGQMAAFLVRALDLPPASGGFTDTRNSVFAADIAALANAGVTRGCNPPRNDRFCPEDFVTRGQMAAFLVRAGLTD